MVNSLLSEYLADVGREMRAASASIRRDFATHRPSAGDNREEIVQAFLSGHLPKRFGVSSGLVISNSGAFSNQADLLIVDDYNNAPLYASARNKLWPVESVSALVEVKTKLGPAEIQDAVAKARRFKTLPRVFCDAGSTPRIRDSLVVIWSFGAPSAETFKANFDAALMGVPRTEQPDLVIVPGQFVAQAGTYMEFAKLGQPGSQHRRALEAQHGPSLSSLLPVGGEVWVSEDDALMAGFVWLDSWLRQSGSRLVDPIKYLPPGAGPTRRL